MSVVTEPDLVHRIEGKPKVVVTRRLLPATQARMAELFDATFNESDMPMDRDALAVAMADCHVLVPTVTDRIDAALIEQASESLGLIANFGAGYEHIDMAAASSRKIMVSNTPGVFTEDTADLTMALIIGATRRMGEGARLLIDGKWNGWGPASMLGHCIGGKRLAIVGMGRIGRAVAKRAAAFGLTIVYHNRHRLHRNVEKELGATYEPDIDKLVAEADILTFHCPATEETHHLLNAQRISTMKASAYVVNTARGQLIDEEALIAALSEGRLAGAGIDVYENEPDVNAALLALPSIVALPHQGSATFEGREEAGNKVIANIKAWADGHRPPDQVLLGLD